MTDRKSELTRTPQQHWSTPSSPASSQGAELDGRSRSTGQAQIIWFSSDTALCGTALWGYIVTLLHMCVIECYVRRSYS